MLKNHDSFRSVSGKRQILVADDEQINRALLGEMLKDDYDVLFASDGLETMEMLRQHRDTLSLVLLDILMPNMSGLEVLKAVREDADLSLVPVIVTTAERETEIESLQLGAIDFIPKPYPAVGVILARIQRTIELFEDRDTIRSTERDALTGLYNREYFYRYVGQFDQYHRDLEMDAVIMDVNHFHMINERYGRSYGDALLRRIAAFARELVRDPAGIACRCGPDTFMLYCPHREDYPEVMERLSESLTDPDSTENRVRLRMGIYPCADKSIDIERRFDRAKMAADTVRGSFAKAIGSYDSDLHEKQLFAEQLIEDFPRAIAERQFEVFYQPKFDVRPDTPILSSAEALVRWMHPTLGMVSPGSFIPLFEENGLIQQLDLYVWREAARQMRDWKDRLDFSIPVSVNVSRIDMYDPKLPDTLRSIIDGQQLTGADLLLEVTESAYTQDSSQIIETVERLRRMGFRIEMDDFGMGYSSLNMLSDLPVDALKLDMQFVRSAFREGGNTHMLEVIIGISDHLSVPVIAEGVETEEQLHALKILGCDIVQGYFFSRPVRASEFEAFILQKKEADLAAGAQLAEAAGELLADQAAPELPKPQLRQSDGPAAAQEAGSPPVKGRGLQLSTLSIFFAVLAAAMAAALLINDLAVTRGSRQLEQIPAGLSRLISVQTVMTVVFMLIVLCIILLITHMIRRPLAVMMRRMQAQESIPPSGVEELRFVARTYNTILQENREANEKLRHEASHDALTGLFNRGAYDLLMESADTEHMALILIDVDEFKSVNDTYGHAVGDRVLKRVAAIMRQSFRSVDILCRIGGDEFAVIMTRVNSSMGRIVLNKIAQANELLQHPRDDLPPVSLSVGVAFSDRKNPRGDIFHDADTALYQVKEAGRRGCRIYSG